MVHLCYLLVNILFQCNFFACLAVVLVHACAYFLYLLLLWVRVCVGACGCLCVVFRCSPIDFCLVYIMKMNCKMGNSGGRRFESCWRHCCFRSLAVERQLPAKSLHDSFLLCTLKNTLSLYLQLVIFNTQCTCILAHSMYYSFLPSIHRRIVLNIVEVILCSVLT